MIDNDRQLTVPLLKRGITRREMLLTTGGALAGILLAGCGGGGGAQKSAPLVTGSFVGEIPDADTFVAIIANEAEQGADEREVLAYLCDAPFAWFKGSAAENEFSLTGTAEDPSLGEENAQEVEVTLAPETATGTFTLLNGRSLPFEATPPTGVAGLYQATLSPDGLLNGPSERGGEMDARLAEDESGDPAMTVMIGTFAGPDGESVPFRTPGGGVEPGDLIRFIVLPDGRFKGKVQKTGSGGSYSDWICMI